MLLQTNSYIVPKERRAEHARLIRRFRQALARIGCDQFEVYEQVGANWSPGGANGRYVQIMRFRDRQHQQAVQAAEREDHGAQHIIAEFCELINFPYQQQHGYFATGFYTSVLPVGPRQAIENQPVEEYAETEPMAEEMAAEEAAGEELGEEQGLGEEISEEEAAVGEVAPAEEWQPETQPLTQAEQVHDAEVTEEFLEAQETAELPAPDPDEEAALAEELAPPGMESPVGEAPPEPSVAEAFLDSLSDEDLPPVEELGGVTASAEQPTAGGEHEAAELNFAEAPIGAAPIEEAAHQELVTAEAFVPSSAEPAAHMEPEPLGESDLAPEPAPLAEAEPEIAGFGAPLSPDLELDETELAELGTGESELDEQLFGEPESLSPPAHQQSPFAPEPSAEAEPAPSESTHDASAELHRDVLEDLGLEFAEHGAQAGPALEAAPLRGDEFGLDFEEPALAEAPAPEVVPPPLPPHAMRPTSDVLPPLPPQAMRPASEIVPPPLPIEAREPGHTEHSFGDEPIPLELSEAPSVLEPVGEEFELDEGLIFDDDDLPAEIEAPVASTPAPAAHSDDASFDSLLDDPDLLAHVQTPSENGNSAAHEHHESAQPQHAASSEDKDLDLLEFDEFLRELDKDHGRQSK